MLRLVIVFGLVFGYQGFSSQAHASADGSCYPEWSLYSRDRDCSSSAVIAPGNDTRANLLLLLIDSRGGTNASQYPELDWERAYGQNFFSWPLARAAFDPQSKKQDDADDTGYSGSRCVSFPSGSAAFKKAIAANSRISGGDRKKLEELRIFIEDVCKGKDYWGQPPAELPEIITKSDSVLDASNLGSAAANEYVTYLKGASDFYGGDFASALAQFSTLESSKDAWLKETATYMMVRVHLNASQEDTFDKWGSFQGPKSTDSSDVSKAEQALTAYLKNYPAGAYARSARGLMRRVYWLRQDLNKLAAEYQKLISKPSEMSAFDLAEEVDLKLLFAEGSSQQIDQPILLAIIDLMRMRSDDYNEAPIISYAELEAQKAKFASNLDLYDFVLANHAFYVEGDAKKVLKLIPDAARQENFSYLQFSRQMLRGTALKKLGDRNEGGFWREMLTGAKSLYQRPAVELGLASFYERNGELGKALAENSPVQEAGIRKILLQEVAGPDQLRAVVKMTSRPQHERDLALFTLLYNNLSRGNYAAFVKDHALLTTRGNGGAGLWQLASQLEIPVGLFGADAKNGEYSCPSLRKTAETLAAAPRDAKARLCLGDFWLENGFDYFTDEVSQGYLPNGSEPPLPRLGDSKSQFPGSAIPRHQFYTEIIADPRANPDDKAYALYRIVRCYATSGNNSCGGTAVDIAQRKAWFQQLKRSYPNSKWAQKLKYHW